MQPRKEGKRRTNQDSEPTPPLALDDSKEESAADKVEKANGHSAQRPVSNEDKEPDGPDFDAAVSPRVEQAKSRAETVDEAVQARAAQARVDYPDDLVARGRELALKEVVCYPNVKTLQDGRTEAKATDPNRKVAFDALFGDGPTRPHADTFRGRLIDDKGVIINNDYSVVNLTMALNAMGLKGNSFNDVKSAFKQWAQMKEYERNSLIERLKVAIPVWDGVPRMRRQLIDMFECKDTPLTEDFSEYLWLSIYKRATDPGCYAPMIPCLIGEPFSGKSQFSVIISQTIIGRKDARPVDLDLSEKWLSFLRQITGQAFIANVGELTGYDSGDMNRIKSFVTRPSDPIDYKYCDNREQARQWIIMMDGNRYAGVQRDPTGNRRFYPIHCGEDGVDEDGRPYCRPDFAVNFVGFDVTVMQIMAECRERFKTMDDEAWILFVDPIVREVMAFNQTEMDNLRGTSDNAPLERSFGHILRELLDCTDAAEYKSKNTRYYVNNNGKKVRGRVVAAGVAVSSALFNEIYKRDVEDHGVNFGRLDSMAKIYGAAVYGRSPSVELKGGQKFYIFPKFTSIDAMKRQMDSDEGLCRVEIKRRSGDSGF